MLNPDPARIESTTAMTPIAAAPTRAAIVSSRSVARPWRTICVRRSCATAPLTEITSPETTARMVAKATALTAASIRSPPVVPGPAAEHLGHQRHRQVAAALGGDDRLPGPSRARRAEPNRQREEPADDGDRPRHRAARGRCVGHGGEWPSMRGSAADPSVKARAPRWRWGRSPPTSPGGGSRRRPDGDRRPVRRAMGSNPACPASTRSGRSPWPGSARP